MKLIFENFKKNLAENLSYFGNSFVEFKNRVDSGEDPLNVAEDILYPLGEGSTRVVFEFPDNQDFVLKVINTKNPELDKGEDKFGFTKKHKTVSNQNEVDFQIHQAYPGLFPKAYERSPDFSWILTERVSPMDHQEMLQYFGLPPLVNKRAYKNLAAHAVNAFKEKIGINESSIKNDSFKTIPPQFQKPEPSKTIPPQFQKPMPPVKSSSKKNNPYSKENLINILTTNPQSKKIFLAAAELGIPATEMTAKNLGTVDRNGKKEVVILDASLWEDR